MMLQKWLDFIIKHWFLVSAFVLAFLALVMEEARSKGVGGKARLSTQDAVRVMNRERGQVIDIRDASLYQAGHIVGAMNVPFNDLENNTDKLSDYKAKNLIIVCANGQKSADMLSKLRKAGYTNLYVLSGGMAAWSRDKMPTTK